MTGAAVESATNDLYVNQVEEEEDEMNSGPMPVVKLEVCCKRTLKCW